MLNQFFLIFSIAYAFDDTKLYSIHNVKHKAFLSLNTDNIVVLSGIKSRINFKRLLNANAFEIFVEGNPICSSNEILRFCTIEDKTGNNQKSQFLIEPKSNDSFKYKIMFISDKKKYKCLDGNGNGTLNFKSCGPTQSDQDWEIEELFISNETPRLYPAQSFTPCTNPNNLAYQQNINQQFQEFAKFMQKLPENCKQTFTILNNDKNFLLTPNSNPSKNSSGDSPVFQNGNPINNLNYPYSPFDANNPASLNPFFIPSSPAITTPNCNAYNSPPFNPYFIQTSPTISTSNNPINASNTQQFNTYSIPNSSASSPSNGHCNPSNAPILNPYFNSSSTANNTPSASANNTPNGNCNPSNASILNPYFNPNTSANSILYNPSNAPLFDQCLSSSSPANRFPNGQSKVTPYSNTDQKNVYWPCSFGPQAQLFSQGFPNMPIACN